MEQYDASKIKVLEGLEGVQKRPSMYVGSTGKDGLHHLVYEVVDNSVDEALAGHCKTIKVFLNKDGSASIEDDGRGIPVDMHPIFKIPAVQVALTKLHAGGKFDKKSYMISGGLHGVGISVVNALSKKLIVEVKRDGKIYQQEYAKGKAISKLKVIGSTNGSTGTKVIFWPDKEIFSIVEFDSKVLETRFREVAFLNAGLKIILNDEKTGKKQEFFSGGGLMEFVKWINRSKEVMHKPIYFKNSSKDMIVEVAIQYNTGYQENIFGFVNTINTVEGGTHIVGFKTALTRVINDYIKKKAMLKNDSLMGNDVREGITAIISVKIPDPQFEGQTKTKLGNSEVKGFVDSIVTPSLSEFFEENPAIAKKIVSKALDSAKARLAAKRAKDLVRRKNAFSLGGLPGKLHDCSKKKSDDTELYLVEGESAGGSSKMARNKEIQAILPLKGKILNVEKASPARTLSSEEITNMITAIGTGVGEQFNIDKLRYNKIIIMCDADSVTYDTPLLFFDEKGELCHKYIGDFVENILNPKKFKISSFSIDSGKHKIKKITNIVKHPLRTKLYNIKTYLGYNVNVTPYHSVFVYNNGKIFPKETKDITSDDYILIPKSLPRTDKEMNIDLRDLAKDYDIRVNLQRNEIKKIPPESYVNLSIEEWVKLKELRKSKKISRKKLGKLLRIYPTVLQQWEFKKDNVMPKYGLFKKYLSLIGYDIKKLNFNVNVPLKYVRGSNIKKSYFRSHTKEIKIKLNFDADLAYLLGWYLGDGCLCRGKKNPYRFGLCIGKDKKFYLEKIKTAIKNSLGCNIILEDKKNQNYSIIYFNSLGFNLLLKKLGLEGLKASEKFVPDVIYNLKKDFQMSFLRGLLESDGSIVVAKNKAVLDYATTSKKLMEGIVFLYRQLGLLPSVVNSKSKSHKYKGVLIRSNHIKYDVLLGSIKQLKRAKEIWKHHKNAHKLGNFITNAKKIYDGKFVINVNKDFQAIKVLNVRKIKSKEKYVYDLSIDLNRSFVGGLGGLTLHNTDGEHIKTLLLTFFFRFMPELIKNGNMYVALPPLYRVRKKKDYYVYSDKELKKITEKLGSVNITRFKGLGEMSANQLWDTTMNPKTRKIKKIFIKDAVEADQVFSMLMGDDVQARKQFIQENAKEAELDV